MSRNPKNSPSIREWIGSTDTLTTYLYKSFSFYLYVKDFYFGYENIIKVFETTRRSPRYVFLTTGCRGAISWRLDNPRKRNVEAHRDLIEFDRSKQKEPGRERKNGNDVECHFLPVGCRKTEHSSRHKDASYDHLRDREVELVFIISIARRCGGSDGRNELRAQIGIIEKWILQREKDPVC